MRSPTPNRILPALVATGLAGAGTAAAAEQARPGPERSPVIVKVDDGGFEWADAAIGAGAALGVGLLAGGVAIVLRAAPESQRKARRKP